MFNTWPLRSITPCVSASSAARTRVGAVRTIAVVSSLLIASALVPATVAHAQTVPQTAVAKPAEKRERPAPKPVPESPAASATKGAAVPELRSMRFDERYERAPSRGHWSDPLKHIAIDPDDRAWITIGGQLRAREEFANAFLHDPAISDNHGQSRISLNADMRVGRGGGMWARAFAEARDAQVYGRDLPGGVRSVDADRHDIQNAFIDLGWKRSFVRVGRQEIAWGKERLVGVPDWANTRRGSQGVRALAERGALLFEAASIRPMLVRADQQNRADSTTRFHAAQLSNASAWRPASVWLPAQWSFYHYRFDVTGGARAQQRQTWGSRLFWKRDMRGPGTPQLSVEGEGAIQRGRAGADNINAWFTVAETQLQWRSVWSAPALAMAMDLASGDRARDDGVSGAFHSLVPAAHAHGGYADVLGRANLRELRVVATADPFGRAALRAAWHRFDRRELTDGVYNKQNAPWRAAGSSTARHAADEIDLTSNFKISRELRLIAGYAWVLPGQFLREQATPHTTMRWGFVGTSYTF